MVTPAQAAASIDEIVGNLDRPAKLAQAVATATLAAARRRASGRPTPQARMAASGLSVDDGVILGPSYAIVSGRGGSTTLGNVLGGSEFGSTLYPQFGPRRRGAWLTPAVDEAEGGVGPSAVAGEAILAEIIERAV